MAAAVAASGMTVGPCRVVGVSWDEQEAGWNEGTQKSKKGGHNENGNGDGSGGGEHGSRAVSNVDQVEWE